MRRLRLLDRAEAARAWGWRDGQRLHDHGHDEALREMLQCIATRRGRRWHAIPAHRPVFRKRDDALGDEEVVVRFNGRESTWHFWVVSVETHPEERTHLQCLFALAIRYALEGLLLSVTYKNDDRGGHYYVQHGALWIDRCETASECVTLLDALDVARMHALSGERTMRTHFESELAMRASRLDSPRGAYIARRLGALSDGSAQIP